jgi:hypothetical protein
VRGEQHLSTLVDEIPAPNNACLCVRRHSKIRHL